MNVQANHTKNINNMNIYITHNLGYNPFQIYNHRQQRCKTIQVIFKAATIRPNIQLCSGWLQNVSRGLPIQVVARLKICTSDNANKHCILYYCTLLLTSWSNPVTRDERSHIFQTPTSAFASGFETPAPTPQNFETSTPTLVNPPKTYK